MLTPAQIEARKGKPCELCGTIFHPKLGAPSYEFRRKRFCSRQCGNIWANKQRWNRYDAQSAMLTRFENKFIPEPNSGCWLWLGSQVPDGYGIFGFATKYNIKAHRVAWLLYRGAIPHGAHVLHHCDNRACVNPDHLFLGDNNTNVADRVAKGRSGTARGELHPCALLTNAQVLAILKDRRKNREIANSYNVPIYTIQRIKSGQTYRGITNVIS